MLKLFRVGVVFSIVLICLAVQARPQICVGGPGTQVDFVDFQNLDDPTSNCGDLPDYCYEPVITGPTYELVPGSCDPTAGSCSVRASTPVEFPGNGSNPSPPPFGRGWATLDWFNSVGGLAGSCGNIGSQIPLVDMGTGWIQIGGFSCSSSPSSDVYTLVAESCFATSCGQRVC